MSKVCERVLVVVMALLCAGCGSRASNSTSNLILATQPASAAIDAEMIFPMQPGIDDFVLVDENTPVEIRREPTTEFGASIAVSEGDRRTEFLARSEAGEIALTAVIDRKEKALTLFDPPLIIAPASLATGETFESEASMRVVDIANPQKQRERGKARRRITYVGDAVIRTPRGNRRVAQIDIAFTADLRLADAEEQTTLYVSRDSGEGGVIVSDSLEKITILGAFPSEARRVLVRQ